MKSLLKNKTWTLTELPPGRKAIGCKWVFKVKPDKYKARLVAQGYSQVKGIDYEDTYAPVLGMKSLRLLLALSCKLHLYLHQMDVATAFLNGKISEDLYMKQPPVFVDKENPKSVCKLNKSLYGLKQSPKEWNTAIDTWFIGNNFTRLKSELCLYYKKDENGLLIIGLYVDDLVIAGSSLNIISKFKNDISGKFEVKDLGEIGTCLGIEIDQNAETWEVFCS